ncbi:MAG: hypothetical protein OJF61_001181 [Rhodanobacteraceae bacterium]|jgi:hypothetical protein|nr:MAG: hypothetical protein OJF61_001181 [Rhodanobacteraceae bacterium]
MNHVDSATGPEVARLPVGAALVFAVFGAPVAWFLQLCFGYALSAHACFPLDVPLVMPVWPRLWWWLVGIDLGAVIVAGAALFTAWGCHVAWRGVDPRNPGERRNRFIAHWSVLTSTLFAIAVVFTIVMLFIEPVCNY